MYHLFHLALYALSVWIVYQLGRKLLQNELAAFAGALLWAVHPLHVEVVAWVSSIQDMGCTLFCLLGFWMFLRAEEHSPTSFRWHAAAAAVYFPALFFKEMAFSFPLLLLAYWFCNPLHGVLVPPGPPLASLRGGRCGLCGHTRSCDGALFSKSPFP